MGDNRRGYAVSVIGRLRRIRPPRGRTLVGGVLLGGALVVALLFAGVVGVPGIAADRSLGRWSTPEPRPLTGRQPELTGALLTGGDLPGGYVPAAPAPRTPPPRIPPRTAPPRQPEGIARLAGCRELFERPSEVATLGAPPLDRAVVELSELRHGAVLRQALAVFGGDGARAAFQRVREIADGCRQFDATLDDGTRVRVRARELPVPTVAGDAYALLLTARGGQRTYVGYLAVGRIGPVVTVLRHVGPAGSVEAEDAAAMLRRSLEKAGPFVARRWCDGACGGDRD